MELSYNTRKPNYEVLARIKKQTFLNVESPSRVGSLSSFIIYPCFPHFFFYWQEANHPMYHSREVGNIILKEKQIYIYWSIDLRCILGSEVGTHLPSPWIKLIWVLVIFFIHMNGTKGCQDAPTFGDQITCRTIVRWNKINKLGAQFIMKDLLYTFINSIQTQPEASKIAWGHSCKR